MIFFIIADRPGKWNNLSVANNCFLGYFNRKRLIWNQDDGCSTKEGFI
jgi:hypothetical protein